jgi:hypothetical protein
MSSKASYKNIKYKIEYEGKKYECETQKEIANICGVSKYTIFRLLKREEGAQVRKSDFKINIYKIKNDKIVKLIEYNNKKNID